MSLNENDRLDKKIVICGKCQGAKVTILKEAGGTTNSEICTSCKGTGCVEVQMVRVAESGRLSESDGPGVGLLANRLTD